MEEIRLNCMLIGEKKMRVLYFCYCPEEKYLSDVEKLEYYSTCVGAIVQSREFIQGLREKGIDVTVCCLIPYKHGESPRKIVQYKAVGGNYVYLSYLNLPVMKVISSFFSAYGIAKRWIKGCREDDNVILVALNNYLPVSAAVNLAKKKALSLTYTQDLTNDLYSGSVVEQMSPLKRLLVKPYVKITKAVTEKYDGFIYVSGKMSEKMNILHNRPSMVLEGICEPADKLQVMQNKKNAVMYAGSLHKKYGIMKILETFSRIEKQDIELWICGRGEMENEVRCFAERDNRIKYLGFRSHNEIIELEQQARLLINLRDPKEEYTKYCFPGKMFDYMLSGTPVYTTKVEGIGNDYYKHLYFTQTYNEDDMSKDICSILDKEQTELDSFGQGARRFVLEKASRANQTSRFIEFVKGMLQQ